ncbi:hypothetical protein C8R43DRAFT_1005864, partial [Mycena crocata]
MARLVPTSHPANVPTVRPLYAHSILYITCCIFSQNSSLRMRRYTTSASTFLTLNSSATLAAVVHPPIRNQPAARPSRYSRHLAPPSTPAPYTQHPVPRTQNRRRIRRALCVRGSRRGARPDPWRGLEVRRLPAPTPRSLRIPRSLALRTLYDAARAPTRPHFRAVPNRGPDLRYHIRCRRARTVRYSRRASVASLQRVIRASRRLCCGWGQRRTQKRTVRACQRDAVGRRAQVVPRRALAFLPRNFIPCRHGCGIERTAGRIDACGCSRLPALANEKTDPHERKPFRRKAAREPSDTTSDTTDLDSRRRGAKLQGRVGRSHPFRRGLRVSCSVAAERAGMASCAEEVDAR